MSIESYMQLCARKIENLGFTVDENTIYYSVKKAINYVKKFCNIRKIPKDLEYEVIDYACGIAVEKMKNCGTLRSDFLVLDRNVEKVKEGDTEVTFSEKSSDWDKVNDIIAALKNIDDILVMYRKIVW